MAQNCRSDNKGGASLTTTIISILVSRGEGTLWQECVWDGNLHVTMFFILNYFNNLLSILILFSLQLAWF